MQSSDRTECVQSLAALSLTEASDHQATVMIVQSTLVVLNTEWRAAPEALQSEEVYCPELQCSLFWVRAAAEPAAPIALVVQPSDMDNWSILEAETEQGFVVNTNAYTVQRAWDMFKQGRPSLTPAVGVVAQVADDGTHVYSVQLSFRTQGDNAL